MSVYLLKVILSRDFLVYVFKQFNGEPGRYGKNKHFSAKLHDVKSDDTLQCAEHNGLTIPILHLQWLPGNKQFFHNCQGWVAPIVGPMQGTVSWAKGFFAYF